jgi:amino acid transporter
MEILYERENHTKSLAITGRLAYNELLPAQRPQLGVSMKSDPATNSAAKPRLGLFDAISIIVGIIIGAGIYETPRLIFSMMPNEMYVYGIWGFCGLLALIGALCYAELATAYPRSGGDYVYHTRAYGPLMGYLFGWTQLAVIQTGSIGLMAYIFAEYGNRLWTIPNVGNYGTAIYAGGAILAMSLLNIIGVVLSKVIQDLLTLAKVLGLGGIVVVGFMYAPKHSVVVEGKISAIEKDKVTLTTSAGEKSFQLGTATKFSIDGKNSQSGPDGKALKDSDGNEIRFSSADFKKDMNVRVVTDVKNGETVRKLKTTQPAAEPPPWTLTGFLAAMAFPFVLVLLTYGGWNDAAFVAAEVKNPNRNIPLALILGTLGVTVIYLAVNAGYLSGLGGFRGAQEAGEVAADVLSLLPWDFAEKAMCILVMVSALGAVNGLIFTSSRIYSTMGSDYSLFHPLSLRSGATGSPVCSLLLQMVISLLMVLSVGTEEGQHLLNEALQWLGQTPVNWAGKDGFSTLLQCTAPIFWIFFLLTAFAVLILRINEPEVPRPFRVPLYPLLPLIFCLYCGYMVYSGINYAGSLGLVGAVLVLLGFPFYVFSRRSAAARITLPASSH